MNEIVKVSPENPSYSSMKLGTLAEKKRFYNAVENPTGKLSDYINKKLAIKDVSMQLVDIMEKDDKGEPTGVIKQAVKTVIVTPDGKGIFSTSMGLARSLYSLFGIFGTPDTWGGESIEVLVKQVDIGKNRTFRLEVV